MIVEINGLSKHFQRKNQPDFKAVDEISMNVDIGERVAFIGPNGAGKSTTLKMLTGILYPTSGEASVAGFTPWQERQQLAYHIGLVFGQRSQLWYHLPVQDSFDLLSKIYDIGHKAYMDTLTHLKRVLDIESLMNKSVSSLSLGQRMRCEIAASLLHKPKILFLDEPTIGLDLTAKAQLREHLKYLAETEETTIMLTSHDTGDIEEICQRVILINHGNILVDTSLEQLKKDFMTRKQIVLTTMEETPELSMTGVETAQQERHRLVIWVDQHKASIDSVIGTALSKYSVQDITIETTPLESIIRDLYDDKWMVKNG